MRSTSTTELRPTRIGVRSYSMIELLVATTVVVVVAALFMGFCARVRDDERRVECLSNLRQLGLAFHLYGSDHAGQFPFPNNSAFGEDGAHRDLCWFCALDPLLSSATNIATSAAQERALLIKQDPIMKRLARVWWTNMHTIKMNENLGRYDPFGVETRSHFWRMVHCPVPGRTVLLFDGRGEEEQTPEEPLSIISIRSDGTEGYVARRHRGGANVLLVDGHVEYRREKVQTAGLQRGWQVNETALIWKPWQN